jgi:hypothetical protein
MSDIKPKPKNIFFDKKCNKFLVVILLLLLLVLIFQFSYNRPIGEVDLTTSPNVKPVVSEVIKDYPRLVMGSFGDNFSSSAYLDTFKTNMVLDNSVTALVFPPVYNLSKTKDCLDETCDFNKEEIITSNKKLKYCLGADCLETKGPDLLFNNKKLVWPRELRGQKMINISVHSLSSSWLVSFVMSEGSNDKAYIYSFDGKNFEPIINNKTSDKIITQYNRGGGTVFFGGVDNDFIIFYSGYETIAYHFKNGKLFDISRFFGLRISTSGFKPHIIRQGEGKDVLWYLIDTSNTSRKFIKLWQNGTDNIKGAYDLSNIFIKIAGATNPFAVRENGARGQLDFIFTGTDNKIESWSFADNGFNNSVDHLAVSNNLVSEDVVYKAFIEQVGLALNNDNAEDYEATFPNEMVKFYLSNDGYNFIETKPDSMVDFTTADKGLFWKIEFKRSSNKEYSPWFDHLNSVNYFIEKKD